MTGIDKSAPERIYGRKDAGAAFNAWFNDAITAGAEGSHTVLKALPATDIQAAYLRGIGLGSPAFCFQAKQVDYNPTRSAEGDLSAAVQALANAYGGNWCDQYTAGKVTHASAANGAAIDLGSVSTLFGMTAYLQVFSVATGTVVGRMEDSADNVTFAAIAGLTFTGLAARGAERLATGATATIRRYTRFASTGVFTNAVAFAAAERHTADAIVA